MTWTTPGDDYLDSGNSSSRGGSLLVKQYHVLEIHQDVQVADGTVLCQTLGAPLNLEPNFETGACQHLAHANHLIMSGRLDRQW